MLPLTMFAHLKCKHRNEIYVSVKNDRLSTWLEPERARINRRVEAVSELRGGEDIGPSVLRLQDKRLGCIINKQSAGRPHRPRSRALHAAISCDNNTTEYQLIASLARR